MLHKISTILFLFFFSIASPANEAATARFLHNIQTDPNKLRIFLQNMPKGGDLHNHLNGEVYAEDLLHYAMQPKDHYCLDQKTFIVTKNENCLPENHLTNLPLNSQVYNAAINAWSMRNFIATNTESKHDHFFAAFYKFNPIMKEYDYKALPNAMRRAAKQNINYLEIMVTPYETESANIIKPIIWTEDLPTMHQKFIAAGLLKLIPELTKQIDQLDMAAKHELSCATKYAKTGCSVKIKYLYQTQREQSPSALFAQLLLAFAAVQHNSKLVGINIVQPEDGYLAMRDYNLHMRMIGFLHKVYPEVNISLHAGELYLGLVRPEDLRFHIREAVEIGQAKRIGHGVSIAFEDKAEQLLKEMAQKHILVEINLTSNADILGVQDNRHPLELYIHYNVPVTLSTDDEGILRIDLTNEYVRAVMSYNFSYKTLKNFVRNSLAYSFLSGDNLWVDSDHYIPIKACSEGKLGALSPPKLCSEFLKNSEKARSQWLLEKQLNDFENRF